jgi:uncharacterized protein (TIGR03435 family)
MTSELMYRLFCRELSMSIRLLLLFLSIATVVVFGQMSTYGPVTTHLKAGDVAPDIAFTKVLNVPGPIPWRPSNLTGHLTVLVFFPDTSHNLEAVTQWNAVIDQFSGKSVQFIWITGETESTLLRWLSQHPVKGWVFYDPGGKTGKAYGLELPVSVIIGRDRRIVGFDRGILPNATLLNAALEGRITTTRRSRATIQASIENNLVLLDAEPRRMPRIEDSKPDFPPSYALHVFPSHTEGHRSASGPTFWSLKGYDLKDAIQELYGVKKIRIFLPASLDNGQRYDFALSLPEEESRERMRDRLQQGIEDYFHITASRENRLLDAYVVTATDGKPPRSKAQSNDKTSLTSVGQSHVVIGTVGGLGDYPADPRPVSIDKIYGIHVDGTVDDFCRRLEEQLDHPVVNETNLQGQFEFHVESGAGAVNDFLERLHDQTGLLITPEQRTLEVLVFWPR